MATVDEDEEIRIIGGGNWSPAGSDKNKGRKEGDKPKRKFFLQRKAFSLLSVGFLCVLFAAYYIYQQKYVYGFEYPISRTQDEVIEVLMEEKPTALPGVEKSEETYLGVSMHFYKITGLHPELVSGIPDLKDKDVYFVTRNSDYWKKNSERNIIGDYIIEGKQLSSNAWRAGYFSIFNGCAEIGIGREPDMRKFILNNKGSMFRQFALVSGGIKCVSQYVLKGKVTRCAYARTSDNNLFYVETDLPETLYGFSDALIEYGFVDAIYITGGAQPDLFYRTSDGVAHGGYLDDSKHGMVVWRK